MELPGFGGKGEVHWRPCCFPWPFSGAPPSICIVFSGEFIVFPDYPQKRAISAGDLLDNDRFVAIYQAQMVLNGYNFCPWGRNNPGRESP